MKIFVKKLNGEFEPYKEEKLEKSLQRAGADQKTIDKIMGNVGKIIYNGIKTKKLFNFVLEEFKKISPETSPKYDLKNAIMNLGREGYVFEKFVGKILEKNGYKVKLNQEVNGKFVLHEIDVIAKKGKEKLMVECKHHRNPWLGCSIQTALYVQARYMDLKHKFNKAMLVTNTKFSSQVINYSKGVGIVLMGWKYPPNESLEFNIEKFKLYPVTMHRSLNEAEIKSCLKNGIITMEDFFNSKPKKLSRILKTNRKRLLKLFEQSDALIK